MGSAGIPPRPVAQATRRLSPASVLLAGFWLPS
jgi:hypothetical protein